MKLNRAGRKGFGGGGKKKGTDGKDDERRSKPLRRSTRKSEPVTMPDGSGAVVLYEKSGTQLRSVAVIPVKAVLREASQTPGWIAVANVLMPHQLSFGERQPVWKELRRFGAYKRTMCVAKRRDGKA